MTCPDCTEAQAKPWHQFRAGCKGCQARALSRSPELFESRRQGKPTEAYRAALESLGLTHDEVRAAAKTDRVRG